MCCQAAPLAFEEFLADSTASATAQLVRHIPNVRDQLAVSNGMVLVRGILPADSRTRRPVVTSGRSKSGACVPSVSIVEVAATLDSLSANAFHRNRSASERSL